MDKLKEYQNLIDRYTKLNNDYKSILELDKILTEKGIPHELFRLMDGWKIAYPTQNECIFDVVEHNGSYGHQEDLMEAYGQGIEDVEGWLDVEKALAHFERVHKAAERKVENMTERTVITTIEVTEVFKNVPDDVRFNKERAMESIKERVKRALDADDVVVTIMQEFVREVEE